jgi:hypothetical protein
VATATPAPAPSAQTPTGDPYDAIFDKHEAAQGAPEKVAHDTEPESLEASQTSPEEQTPEQKQRAEMEAKWPGKFREEIKEIKDPKVRKALAADHFKAKALTNSGLRIGELQERANLAPTLEIAQHHKAVYDDVVALNDAFNSGTPEGHQRFAEALNANNPMAFEQFVENSFATLPRAFPGLAKKYADHIGKNMIAWARQQSAALGDPDIAAAADIFESTFRLGQAEQAVAAQPADDPRLQRLEEYERQEAQRAATERQQFLDSAYTLAGNTAFGEVTKWADTAFPHANHEGKAWVVEQVARALYQEVTSNRDLAETLKKIVEATNDQEQGKQAIARTILNFIRQKSPAIRAQQGRRFHAMTSAERVKREEKTAQVLSIKDVGAGGVGTQPQAPQKSNPKGRSMDEIFDEFEIRTGIRSR